MGVPLVALSDTHGCKQGVVALVLGMRWGLCVFSFRLRLRHCLTIQILLFRIFCNGEAVQLGRDPVEKLIH